MTSNVNQKWEPKLNLGLVEGELHITKELVWAKRVMERPTPTSKANTECIIGFNKLSI